MLQTYQLVIAGVGGLLGWYLGENNGFIYALIAFMEVDIVSGLLCGILKKNISSKIGAKGLFKKVMILALVGIGHLMDVYIIGSGETVRTTIIFFYLSNEGISILENAALIGLPIPSKLLKILVQMKNKDDREDKDNKNKD